MSKKTPTFGNIGDGLLLGLPRFPGIMKYYRIWIMWKNGELDGISKLPGINVDFKLGIFILSVILWGCNYKKCQKCGFNHSRSRLNGNAWDFMMIHRELSSKTCDMSMG
jgi:hypothetical protein